MAIELEDALRRAMRDEAAEVAAPPTLLADVRRRHQRRTRRTQVVGAVAAGAIVAAAVPATQVVLPLGDNTSVVTPAAPSQNVPGRVVDGVEVTYLPPGLHRDGEDIAYEEGGTKTLGREWRSPSGQSVGVTVIRGGKATESFAELRDSRFGNGPASDTTVRGKNAVVLQTPLTTGGSIRTLVWLERPGLGLMVTTSSGLHDELRKIAEGLRP